MNKSDKERLARETKCITDCINTISDLGEFLAKDGGGCSVSREQARRAQKRVLSHIIDYVNDKTTGDNFI